jgi:CRISPR-associated endoribonuclease Cas6
MKIAGLPEDESLKIRFDISSGNKRTKVIDYRGIKNRVNLCPVIMEGKSETKAFAWNVGLGNSTGIGFGAIY